MSSIDGWKLFFVRPVLGYTCAVLIIAFLISITGTFSTQLLASCYGAAAFMVGALFTKEYFESRVPK